ncbi:hypothetical protein AVEN_202974-1 [Araneus ventricosus]|uniref:Uncharacterized protein n=1 Tax=Araneus ventricosus TaxID=182803 RepID=A0A4Y2FTU1_ARAVE|nr:hypothetical protein AVEN_202974-1 [Araneus ventricosus]
MSIKFRTQTITEKRKEWSDEDAGRKVEAGKDLNSLIAGGRGSSNTEVANYENDGQDWGNGAKALSSTEKTIEGKRKKQLIGIWTEKTGFSHSSEQIFCSDASRHNGKNFLSREPPDGSLCLYPQHSTLATFTSGLILEVNVSQNFPVGSKIRQKLSVFQIFKHYCHSREGDTMRTDISLSHLLSVGVPDLRADDSHFQGPLGHVCRGHYCAHGS